MSNEPLNPRSSILLDPGDLSAPPGSERWSLAVRLQLQATIKDLHDTGNHLKTWRDCIRRHEGWRSLRDRTGMPFASWEEFCRHQKPEGLDIDPEELDSEVERRKLLLHGGDRKSDKAKIQGSNATLIGRDAAYILARLERDGMAGLLERVNSGGMSAHAAAIEAGWRKRMVQLEPTVEGFARAAIKHLAASEIADLIEALKSR